MTEGPPREQGYRVSPGLGTHGAARWVALVTPVPGQACGTRSPQTGCPPPPRQTGGRHHPLPVARGTCHPAWGGSVGPPKPQHYGAPGATLVPLTTGDTQHGGGTSLVTLGDTTPCVCVHVGTPLGTLSRGQWGTIPIAHSRVGVSPLCPLPAQCPCLPPGAFATETEGDQGCPQAQPWPKCVVAPSLE